MRKVQEITQGRIRLKFPASAIDVNMELRDFPMGIYSVEPTGVRSERVLIRPIDALEADEEYELSQETFMQRINSAGAYTPQEETFMRKRNTKPLEERAVEISLTGMQQIAEKLTMFFEGVEGFIQLLKEEEIVSPYSTVEASLDYLGGDAPTVGIYLEDPEEFSFLFDELLEDFNSNEYADYVDVVWDQANDERYVELRLAIL